MRRFLSVFTGLFSLLSLFAQVDPYSPDPNPAPKLPGYKLTWSDEFNYTGKPSSSNWSFENGFVRNEEHQWYQSDNANVANGALQIVGRRESFKNPNYQAGSTDWKKNREYVQYTSSAIHSRGKKSFKYGRFEIRAKIPAVTGAWPAIWTLGDWGEWPENGEIDIMEYYGDGILANAAWGSNTRWQGTWDSSKTPMSYFKGKDANWVNKYHVWVMDWTPEFIKLYLDGELLNTIETAKTKNVDGSNPFTSRNHYVLLNLALGGVNGGDPSKPNYPITYFVDYVRIYQTDANYSDCFNPLDAANNLSPDPTCDNILPGGSGDRVRNRNLMKVYCGPYCGEIKGGTYAQSIAWTPNKSYRVRAMVYPNGDDVVLGVNGLGEGKDYHHEVSGNLQEWQLVDFVFTAPATAGEGGGVFLSGASGSLIDNIEIYETEEAFLQVTRSQLNFNLTNDLLYFNITANQLTENLKLFPPSGITLSKTEITPEEARQGVTISASYNKSTTIIGQNLLIYNSQYNHTIFVTGELKSTTANLIEDWDANGATGTGSEPNTYGWIANGTVGWKTANATSDVRYTDQTAAGSYTYKGEKWAGRVLHLRWDGGVAPGNCFAYPVKLQAGKQYALTGLFAWQANGSSYSIYSIGINSDPNNKGTSYAAYHKTIMSADKFKLFDFIQHFSVPADGTYYVTFDNSGTIMGAVADLQVREGIQYPAELTILPSNVTFSELNKTNIIALQGKYLKEDIQVKLPEGVSLDRPFVSADDINSGVVTLKAEFDGSRTFRNELIEFNYEGVSKSIVANGDQFDGTSLDTPEQAKLTLNAYFRGDELVFDFHQPTAGTANFELYNLQGILLVQHSAHYDTGDQTLVVNHALPAGQYIVRMRVGNDLQVDKLSRF